MTGNGRISYSDLNGGLGNGCGPTLMYGLVIAWIIMTLTGCRTIKDSELTNESHRYSELVSRMDSMMHSSYQWQQELYSKQTSLIDSFKQKERNDSSHSIVINEKGDTVREKIVIYKYLENQHSSQKSETEFLMLRIEKLDSMLNISLEKQALTDSLIREHDKYREVEKAQSLKQRISTFFVDVFIGLIIFILVILGFRLIKKRLWR